MSMGRGRGRGRGNTLPAWMTRGDGPGAADGPPPAGAGRGGGASERRTDEDRGRYDDRDRRDRERGYDRGRERDRDRGYGDDRGRGPPTQRGRGGLGYEDRSRGDRDISWERDRGMGRGRGRTDDVNFVRGEVYDRDRERGRDDRDYRERDRDYDRDRDRGRHDGDRDYSGGMNRGSDPSMGMGRGRGRGRGTDINKPAWMTSGSSGPTGDAPGSSASSPQKDDTMEKLLVQARQVQQERTKREEEQRVESTQRSSRAPGSSAQKDESKGAKEAREEDELRKKQQKEQEEAARKAEEERHRLEQLREEEEQRQLLALVGDVPDDDKMDEGDSSRKRKEGSEDDGDMFEFETEEEREERLARKRREERRKKLRKMEESNGGNEEEMKVDQPRNPAGVVQSETNGNEQDRNEESTANAGPSKMEVDSSEAPEAGTAKDDSGDDSFDIFAADNATPVPTSKNATTANSKRNTAHDAQECDDAEGYYKASIGEIITLPKVRGEDLRSSGNGEDDLVSVARFRVLGIIGKGVFSSVIKCVEESGNDASGAPTGRVIAMKVIRNNEVMARAAAKEMRILRMLCQQRPRSSKPKKKKDANEDNGTDNGDDEEDLEEQGRRERENHNIVRLLDVDPTASAAASKNGQQSYAAPPPEFRSHCIFLFEFLPFNLREVLSKFGKNVGINLTAVRSYARQLLCALAHLERHRVVHADLKPDNILVSANFSTIKLADFGSAFFETDHDNDPTPYLVSRFYRSPEIILGLEYDRMVDLWSLSATLAELFTGSVLFPGKTNNEMLVRFMDAMGPLSHKMVKRHALSYTRMGLQPHFEVGITGGTYQLRKHDIDRVTGQAVHRLVNVLAAKPDARLAQVLLRASKGGDASERVQVMQFADLLNRCLALDPARRLSVREALRHEFFKKKRKVNKEEESTQE
ncbi:hypothetical protein ACHAXT_002967 [Thalassiosira profunda]